MTGQTFPDEKNAEIFRTKNDGDNNFSQKEKQKNDGGRHLLGWI